MQITKIKSEKEGIASKLTEIKRIIEEYYEQLYAFVMDWIVPHRHKSYVEALISSTLECDSI